MDDIRNGNPLILALDLSDSESALDLVRRLRDQVGLFKVGLQLFTAAGPDLVRNMRRLGARVFLDLKLHDIPNTVAHAAVEAAELGIEMMTLHLAGGEAMLRAARKGLDDWSKRSRRPAPLVLGVTVLTSMDDDSLAGVGIQLPLNDLVVRLAQLAQKLEMDGVVASPREIGLIRSAGLDRLLIVTPGIRPLGPTVDDQRRTLSAGAAIAAGADLLVVGRPILEATSPIQAAHEILGEIRHARIRP